MGNAETKERFEKAAKTKMLTAHKLELSNWDKLIERMKPIKGLRTATLSENKFEGAIPPAFICDHIFGSLKVLDLSSNALTNIDVFSPLMRGMTKKGKKDAASAAASSYPPTAVALEALSASTFDVAYPLETLNLSHNKLTALPPLLLMGFKSVKTLNVSHNAITLKEDHSATTFLWSPSLTTLDISHNHVASLPFDESLFASHGQQCFLKLSALQLEGNVMKELTFGGVALPSLQNVNVNHQKKPGGLVAIDPKIFGRCPKLNSIDFEGTPVPRKFIVDKLKKDEDYLKWEKKHASVVDRQLSSNADAKLMD